jgi:hypothetical protein
MCNFVLEKLFKFNFIIYVFIVEVHNSKSCNSRVHAYKNGKTMEDCRQQAKKIQNYYQKKYQIEARFHGQEY